MNAVAGVFLLELNEVDAALLLVTLRSVCVYVSAQVCLCLCVCSGLSVSMCLRT